MTVLPASAAAWRSRSDSVQSFIPLVPSGAASSGNTGGRDESLKAMTYILLLVPYPKPRNLGLIRKTPQSVLAVRGDGCGRVGTGRPAGKRSASHVAMAGRCERLWS